jgi:hypothetical protein
VARGYPRGSAVGGPLSRGDTSTLREGTLSRTEINVTSSPPRGCRKRVTEASLTTSDGSDPRNPPMLRQIRRVPHGKTMCQPKALETTHTVRPADRTRYSSRPGNSHCRKTMTAKSAEQVSPLRNPTEAGH